MHSPKEPELPSPLWRLFHLVTKSLYSNRFEGSERQPVRFTRAFRGSDAGGDYTADKGAAKKAGWVLWVNGTARESAAAGNRINS